MIKFDEFEFVDGGVCAAAGFYANGINVGVKKGSTKKDLAIIYSDVKCNAAALYTQNKVKGAPIIVTQQNLKDGKAQAIIVNSRMPIPAMKMVLKLLKKCASFQLRKWIFLKMIL